MIMLVILLLLQLESNLMIGVNRSVRLNNVRSSISMSWTKLRQQKIITCVIFATAKMIRYMYS
jgi:hypothetical protein